MLEELAGQVLRTFLRWITRRERVLEAPSQELDSAAFGSDWPLTVDDAELFYTRGAIFLEADDRFYPLNSEAAEYLRSAGEEVGDLQEILRRPTEPDRTAAIAPLIECAGRLQAEAPAGRSRLPARWVRALSRVLLLVPLRIAAAVSEGVMPRLTRAARGRSGPAAASLLVIAAVGIVWLATGMVLQELWRAVIGLWREPFLDHGIFFVLAVPVTLFVLLRFGPARLNRHKRGQDQPDQAPQVD